MQQFFINKDATLPTLAMDLIFDGRHDYMKFMDAIQDASITFTMINKTNNVIKIANGECYLRLRENGGCVEQYTICYDWKKRDTKEVGVYEGVFTIHFNGNIIGENTTYPSGDLIMPIREKLEIIIR